MVHTMLRLSRVDPGFDPHNLQTVMFSLAGPAWPDPRKQAFFAEAVERLRAVPGVENAAITYSLPILGSNWWNWFTVAGRPIAPGAVMMDLPSAGIVPVSATYFETLKIPLIRGRSFDRSDTPDSQPVAIINASLVNLYWKARRARRICLPSSERMKIRSGSRSGWQARSPTEGYGPWRTIVGIVGDVKQHGLDQDTPQQIFLPVVQQTRTTVFAVARTRGTVASSSIETAIRDLDRSVPVFNDRTVEQVMREAGSRRRVAAIVLSVFAGAAVLAGGDRALRGHRAERERAAAGDRRAHGTRRDATIRSCGCSCDTGWSSSRLGLEPGSPAPWPRRRSLASLVFGVTVTDPVTLGTVAALLTVVTLLACYIPARSATRARSQTALRSE